MNQIYCIKCSQLKHTEDATTIFTTGFVYNQGVNYSMGICAAHLEDCDTHHHSIELTYAKPVEPVQSS